MIKTAYSLSGLNKKRVGPGCISFIYNTPMIIAAAESPGIPKTNEGIQLPAKLALLLADASTIPSSEPCPYFCGFFDNFLDTA